MGIYGRGSDPSPENEGRTLRLRRQRRSGRGTTLMGTAVSSRRICVFVWVSASPRLCGIESINVRIPPSTRSASNIPVVLGIRGKQSNPVKIAVAPY